MCLGIIHPEGEAARRECWARAAWYPTEPFIHKMPLDTLRKTDDPQCPVLEQHS